MRKGRYGAPEGEMLSRRKGRSGEVRAGSGQSHRSRATVRPLAANFPIIA
ncbi:hypothetical protein [Cohnella fermenti]|nr:hypothetical protein [Cohnella fermenti]